MNFIIVAEWIFSTLFLTMVSAGGLLLAWVVVSFLQKIVQAFYPNFLVPYRTPEPIRPDNIKVAHADALKTAKEFMLNENLRRIEAAIKERNLHTARRHRAHFGVIPPVVKSEEIEFTIESLATAVAKSAQPPPIPPSEKAEFSLATFPNGLSREPRWLCRRRSVRGKGLICAWAATKSERLKMDFQSAARLLGVLENQDSVYILPANSAARVQMREARKMGISVNKGLPTGEECHATATA